MITNPDPRVRTDLFQFLNQYNFAITDNGYFIAYKAVIVKEEAKDEDEGRKEDDEDTEDDTRQ
jgi:hypothetical protein